MTSRVYDRNNTRLIELLTGVPSIEKHIDAYERSAINCGDLKRAVRYNWLRNTYKQGLLSDDEVFLKLLTIHEDSYVKEIIL